MAAITCELKWLKGFLLNSRVHHPKSTLLFCDNHSMLPTFHKRKKHIEVDCHLVCGAIIDCLIEPSYVPTKSQLVDIFTKTLCKLQFEFFLVQLAIFESSHAPT